MQNIEDDNGIGGLNYDDEDRNVPAGDYKFAKNIRNAINAANRGGALTNIMGMVNPTKYILPYNANVFPTGNNRCIGAIEDTVYGTVIFFVWNSTGKHQILRYYPKNIDPNNPHGEIQQVIQYNFGWKRTTRITSAFVVYDDPEGQESGISGDLLYWCDPNPRKINLSKGNIVNKNKGWNIYLPNTISLVPVTNLYFKNFNGVTIFSIGITLSEPTNREQIISDITTQINASSASPVIAESCDCKLVLREKVSGTVWTIETDSSQILVSPENWYGAILIDRFFERIKYPPLQAPQPTFEQDLSYEPNYVQKKVFQFRLEYLYDDKEQSALGVWSQIPINNLSCNGTSGLEYNYIDVDFNDPTTFDPLVLVLLKKIRFIARELNTGKDRAVITLDACEFLDYDYANNVWITHFNFYNDIISNAVDDATAAKLFDDVPLESGAEVFKENRIVEGDCLNGYNSPACVDAKAQIDFADNPNPKLWEVTFYVRVMTYGLGDSEQQGGGYTFYQMFPSEDKYPFWYPNYNLVRGGIFHDITRTENDYPFFGGGGFGAGAGGDFGIRSGMEDTYDQRIPEGGFPIYLAGTPYFGVSKQIDVGLPVDSLGALDTSTDGRKTAIGEYLYDGNDLYSKVTLLVPDGEYVARAASNWCSFGDKLGKGFNYNLSAGVSFQKTSANVWGIVPAGQDPLTQFEAKKEIKFTVSGANIDHAGTFIIADLAPPFDAAIGGDQTDWWQPICGYLYDSFGNTDVNGVGYNGVSVERAIVFYSALDALPPTNPNWELKWQECSTTDHNGYFYGIRGIAANYGQFNIRAYSINGELITNTSLINIGTVSNLFEKTLQQYNTQGASYLPPPYDLGLVICVISTDNSSARGNCSTFLEGDVVDTNGNAISAVSVIYETGRVDVTDINGGYDILAWGDMITPNLGNFPVGSSSITNGTERIVDNLIFALGISCSPTYPNGQEYFPVLITPIGANGTNVPPPYSPTAIFPIPDFIIDESNNPSIKAHKRGGNYTYGLRLYDVAGRLCSVVKAVEIYVPFITEDLGSYSIEDFSGVIYPANTFKYGKPSIKLILAATTTFPSWVSTMQWMRTKNSIYGRYLQWVANQVTYLSAVATESTPEIETSFQNSDAIAIKISIKNIIDYSAQNPDSQIGYTYQAGDRVRLMYDRSLNPINGLNDFEISNYDSATQSIIILPEGFSQEILSGSLFEIFNPKSVATEDEQIYYEVGEVIDVVNGVPQNYSTILTNGDTYWRGRTITVNDEATKFAAAYPVVIEDASVSDFYPSEAQDIGRVGVIDDNFRQIRRPMLLKASNQYIPSTAINGLSSFEALNEKELDRNSGTIKRLVSLNQTIVAITTQREVSNYIQVVTFQQATLGEGVIAVSNQFFGTQYPHAKTLGTDHSGSVFINNGQIFGYHSQRGDVFKYQGDGEAAISDVKMKTYFQQLSNDGVSEVQSVYDRFHEELIMTIWRDYNQSSSVVSKTDLPAGYSVGFSFPSGSSLPELNSVVSIRVFLNGQWQTFNGLVTSITNNPNGYIVIIRTTQSFRINDVATIIFSLPETVSWFNGNDITNKKRWQTFYDFTPETYSQLGNGVVSFVGGKIWLHDKTIDYNKFYGTQYSTKISPVFNQEPLYMKVWQSIWLRSRQSDGKNNWFSNLITNIYGQISRLKKSSFVKRENAFFADYKRDATTSNVQDPILNGQMLRSEAIVVNLENDYTGEIVLYGYSSVYAISQRTKLK